MLCAVLISRCFAAVSPPSQQQNPLMREFSNEPRRARKIYAGQNRRTAVQAAAGVSQDEDAATASRDDAMVPLAAAFAPGDYHSRRANLGRRRVVAAGSPMGEHRRRFHRRAYGDDRAAG